MCTKLTNVNYTLKGNEVMMPKEILQIFGN